MFDKLPNVDSKVTPIKNKITRKYERCEPVYIKKLADSGMSATKIGSKIGSSGSTMQKALEEGGVYKPYELAAKAVYLEEVQSNEQNITAVVKMNADVFGFLKPWLDKHGCKVTVIK